jgi:excisionase family DNA binding protein
MENVQMLLPMEPKAFWHQLKSIVEEVVMESKWRAPVDKHAERPLLKLKEVCEIFHVSKPTLYDWLKQGKIQSVKIQSRRYFHWKDVEELIQKCKVNHLKSIL